MKLRKIGHWIDGAVDYGSTQSWGPVYDPATGVQQAEVSFACADDVDKAVTVAHRAFPAWRTTPLAKRAEVLFRFRDLLDSRRKELEEIVTSEQGKVGTDAVAEVMRSLESIEYACGIPSWLKGEYSEQVAMGIDVFTVRQPLGVVVGITPFNFPALTPLLLFPHAIACGNTFVLKPSEKDPSASLLIAEIAEQAGLPSGVLNVIQGDRTTVDALLAHPRVKAISFIGSTPVAAHIYEVGAKHGKRVQALGGGKNHMIVLPDANLDVAADAAVSAAFGSSGERCMAVSILVAVGGIGDALVDAIRTRLDKVTVGPATDPQAVMGPLITREHLDKVTAYVENAPSQGATITEDGRRHDMCASGGFFLGPTIIDHATPEMDCYREEIFGPVLTVVRVNTYDEALRLVNEHTLGNGAALFTRDGVAARRFQFETDIGMIGVNVAIPAPMSYFSLGGWKASLFGDHQIQGPDSIRFYTKQKVVTSRWQEPVGSKVDLGFPRTR